MRNYSFLLLFGFLYLQNLEKGFVKVYEKAVKRQMNTNKLGYLWSINMTIIVQSPYSRITRLPCKIEIKRVDAFKQINSWYRKKLFLFDFYFVWHIIDMLFQEICLMSISQLCPIYFNSIPIMTLRI